ncbi:undecaprenyl-diphosphate phosphatase [Guggenheimella bovis]
MLEILKAILFGIVEGITEWLPISSTGHMILLEAIVKLKVSADFWNMFLVVIQLGAILAVVVLYFPKIWPFSEKGLKKDVLTLWSKILVACIPAGIIGILFDDKIEELFYNPVSVAIALIVFGILFILVERRNKGRVPTIKALEEIGYKEALIIGFFQLLAAVFPGTSRSGATILGGILIGVSRRTASDFTFLLAIPVMFGASLLKLMKFGLAFTGLEAAILAVGFIVSFFVSVLAIKFLLQYIKKHDFTVFGWYRIGLAIVVLLFFLL